MWRIAQLFGNASPAPPQGRLLFTVALSEVAGHLPADLLGTGLSWVWMSLGQEPGSLPDRKVLTELTKEDASIFTREFAEYYEMSDEKRYIEIYGGDARLLEVASDRDRLRKEIQAFSELRESCLAAVIAREVDTDFEKVILGNPPPPALQDLLRIWWARLGVTLEPDHKWSDRIVRETLQRLPFVPQ